MVLNMKMEIKIAQHLVENKRSIGPTINMEVLQLTRKGGNAYTF
jgi:hypothetical protein